MDRQSTPDPDRLLPYNHVDGAVVLDPATGRILLANEAAARIFGFGCPRALVGVNPLDHVPREHQASLARIVAGALHEDRPIPAVIGMTARDGTAKFVAVTSALVDFGGRKAALAALREITSETAKDDALRAAEESRIQLMDAADEGIVIVQDGKLVYANPSVAAVAGVSMQQMVGRSPMDFVDPDEMRPVGELLDRILAGKTPSEVITMRWTDPAGRPLWAEVREIPSAWRGKPAIMALIRNVTRKRLAEKTLRESEEKYRLLTENTNDMIFTTDLDLRTTYVGPSVQTVLGFTPREHLARDVTQQVTPASLARARGALREQLALGQDPGTDPQRTLTIEMEYYRQDGSTVWLENRVSAIRDAGGNLTAFHCVARDVSQRRRAEEALKASEERFRGLVETTCDLVWETDRTGRYSYVSPRIRDMLGYQPDELLGHTPYEFIDQGEVQQTRRDVRTLVASCLPFSLLENTWIHKDGHRVALESSAVPIIEADGSLLGYRGINRDITERKRVQQELQSSLKRLERTMQSTIEAFTTTIETRDPYTAGHQMRVTDLACAIARVMGLPPARVQGVQVAGLLHDIGKIAIPTEILSKPGRLSNLECVMIKTHARVGFDILQNIEFHWPVARTILQHHERWNGSGYPGGIRRGDILLEARILAVADVVEAMSSHRPYRPSMGPERALQEITRNSGILYDPEVARACVAAFTTNGFSFAPSAADGRS